MEIIRFVLSDFWVWLGAVILILAIGQAAVEIIKEYFRRFGTVLAKNITMKGMKPVIEKSMTEEKAREIRAWVQAQVEAHAFVTQDTISATQSFRHKLQNR